MIYELATFILCAEAIPAATAEQIASNPDAAVQANAEAATQMVEAFTTSEWLGWGIGAGLVVLGIARKVAPGLWGWGAEMVYNLLAPYAKRREQEKAKTLAGAAKLIIESVEVLPNHGTIGELKETLRDKVPEEVEKAIHEVAAELKAKNNAGG